MQRVPPLCPPLTCTAVLLSCCTAVLLSCCPADLLISTTLHNTWSIRVNRTHAGRCSSSTWRRPHPCTHSAWGCRGETCAFARVGVVYVLPPPPCSVVIRCMMYPQSTDAALCLAVTLPDASPGLCLPALPGPIPPKPVAASQCCPAMPPLSPPLPPLLPCPAYRCM